MSKKLKLAMRQADLYQIAKSNGLVDLLKSMGLTLIEVKEEGAE